MENLRLSLATVTFGVTLGCGAEEFYNADSVKWLKQDWKSNIVRVAMGVEFFKEMAQTCGQNNNVIYEGYNEPLQVSWSNTVKPYAEAVIAAIREIDPDNLIIVGSPNWSQDVDVASEDPITGFDNIAYTLHFYAGTHK